MTDAAQEHRDRMARFASEAKQLDREIGRLQAVTELLEWVTATDNLDRGALLAKLFEMGFAPAKQEQAA